MKKKIKIEEGGLYYYFNEGLIVCSALFTRSARDLRRLKVGNFFPAGTYFSRTRMREDLKKIFANINYY